MVKKKEEIITPEEKELYSQWMYKTDFDHLIALRYEGTDVNVVIPGFYDIKKNAFEGKTIESLTLLRADKLHHLWNDPMPGCENVRRLTLHYGCEGAVFLHLREWAERLPQLSEIEVLCPHEHHLIIWEGVPNLQQDVLVTDRNCDRINVYGHTIQSVDLPTDHFYLSVPTIMTQIQDQPIRAAVMWTALRKPERLPEGKADEYIAFLKRNGTRLLPVLMRENVCENVQVSLFRALPALKAEQYERLLAAAQNNGNMAMTAIIVEKQNLNIDRDKEELKRERQAQYDFDHPFSARNMKEEWNWETLSDDTICLRTCKIQDTETIFIPPEIAGKPVTVLGEKLFAGMKIRRVVIPESVLEIRDKCFSESTVQSVQLPAALKKLGVAVFAHCRSLKEITIPEGIWTLPPGTFFDSRIQKVHLPQTMTVLGKNAFEKCVSLTAIDLPGALERIEAGCFIECGFQDITLPTTVTSLGNRCFSGSCIRNFTWPGKIGTIPACCFAGSSLEHIHLPDSLEQINDSAFAHCAWLSEVSCDGKGSGKGVCALPDSLVRVSTAAFLFCRMLKSVNLPQHLEDISHECFKESGLEHVDIPDSVRRIKKSAFARCRSLKSITFTPNSKLESLGETCFKITALENIILPGSLRIMYNQPFDMCSKLRRVEFPVTTEYAPKTMETTGLSRIEMPEESETIVWALTDKAEPESPGTSKVKSGRRSF